MTENAPFSVITETDSYLIINKPAGLLSQGTAEEQGSAIKLVKEINSKQYYHLLSRIDRPVSGALLISKSDSFTKTYLEHQNTGKVRKNYIALVEGKLEVKNEELQHYHFHHKRTHKAHLSDTPQKNHKAVGLSIDTIATLDNYTVVSVDLVRGAFHQIRAQLAHIGHPIKADVKYGARRGQKDRSIFLHSYSITFPYKETTCSYQAPLPDKDRLWQIANNKITS